MHDEIGLLVDTPRAGGSGTSNTGNTARKAFQNESKFAEILGIDPELIHRIHLMLIAVNADVSLDLDSFREYGRQTAELWINKYPHFYMPVSLHLLFIHSWEAIPFSPLPDSFFTEQSLESANKTFKADRLHHARRNSRLNTRVFFIRTQFIRTRASFSGKN